ncbi:MAG: response regulator transcription factor [Caldilineaceae bacterium]|nr:response regulator transcription factor [Caldilineaceae bacterium]
MSTDDDRAVIRLIIADDHVVVREGLVALLEDEPDLRVVGQAGTGREAVALARQHRPDIALLDITMPDENGLEAARRIVAELPQVKVLILTMHEEEAFFFAALRAGAAGYVLKGAGSDELLSALRAVHEGGVYLLPKLAGSLVQDYLNRHPQPSTTEPLTPREQEIVTLISQGLTNREIAERLTVTINTVKTHRQHIYQKLDLRNRAGLIDYALRRGFLHT